MKKFLLPFVAALLCFCIKVQAQTIQPDTNGILYVDSAIATSGDGSSWATAVQSFDAALHNADSINNSQPAAADSVRQIWVAKGTYQPASGQSFYMLPNVKIYGGFAGTETSLAERDLSSSDTCILKGNGNSVIRNFNNGLNASAVLDGFMITGGSAGSTGSDGAGIFNYNSSPTLKNLTISGNSTFNQGGGMSNENYSSPTLINVKISGNSGGNGGGMENKINSSPTLINVTISENSTSSGGAMDNLSSSPTLINVTISGNSGGGAISSVSDPLFGSSSVTLYNSIVWGSISNLGIGGTYTAQYSLIENSSSTASGNIDATGLSDTDIFNDPANGNYSLNDSSAAINAGSNVFYTNAGGNLVNDLDLAGNPRLYGDSVDLGAYEFQGAPLPVKTGLLKGQVNQMEHTVLSWKTFSESNNKGFQIQHSVDGAHFTNDVFIISKAPEGNSSMPLDYSVDMGILTGTRYYRFQQIYFDGRKTYSNIVRLQFLGKGLEYQLYPNPAHRSVTFTVSGDKPGGLVQLINQNGQVLKKIVINAATTQIDLKGLPSGIYLLLYFNNGQQIERKFIKL